MTIPKDIDWGRLEAIIDKHRGDWALIPLLQDIQETLGYIPEESIETIAEALNLFPSQVQGVISFYAGLSLKPKGKYVIRVCRGTACHVKGAEKVMDVLREKLNIDIGESTDDMNFSLEEVRCIGACSLAPAVVVNEETYGQVKPKQVSTILKQHESSENG